MSDAKPWALDNKWTDSCWKHNTRQTVIWKCSLKVCVEEVQELRNPLHSFLRAAIVFPKSDLPHGTTGRPSQHSIVFVGLFLLLKQADLLRGKPGNSILMQCSSGKFSSDKRWSRAHWDKIQTYLYSVRFESFCIFFPCAYEPMLMGKKLFAYTLQGYVYYI